MGTFMYINNPYTWVRVTRWQTPIVTKSEYPLQPLPPPPGSRLEVAIGSDARYPCRWWKMRVEEISIFLLFAYNYDNESTPMAVVINTFLTLCLYSNTKFSYFMVDIYIKILILKS